MTMRAAQMLVVVALAVSALAAPLDPQVDTAASTDSETECRFGGATFADGSRIEDTVDPCAVRFCIDGVVRTTQLQCFARDDCPARVEAGRCCPSYDHCPGLGKFPQGAAEPYPADAPAPAGLALQSIAETEEATAQEHIPEEENATDEKEGASKDEQTPEAEKSATEGELSTEEDTSPEEDASSEEDPSAEEDTTAEEEAAPEDEKAKDEDDGDEEEAAFEGETAPESAAVGSGSAEEDLFSAPDVAVPAELLADPAENAEGSGLSDESFEVSGETDDIELGLAADDAFAQYHVAEQPVEGSGSASEPTKLQLELTLAADALPGDSDAERADIEGSGLISVEFGEQSQLSSDDASGDAELAGELGVVSEPFTLQVEADALGDEHLLYQYQALEEGSGALLADGSGPLLADGSGSGTDNETLFVSDQL